MNDKLTKEQIKIAVDWWGDTICNPKHDNGDDSEQGTMLFMLAKMAVQEISEKQKDAFKKELTELLKDELPHHGLDCDYGPDMILGQAMEKAKINSANAPWKTNMDFRDGEVTVSYGYGAKRETLANKA